MRVAGRNLWYLSGLDSATRPQTHALRLSSTAASRPAAKHDNSALLLSRRRVRYGLQGISKGARCRRHRHSWKPDRVRGGGHLRRMSPDLVLQEATWPIQDRVPSTSWTAFAIWAGEVMGNTDEMLVRPSSLEDFARQSSARRRCRPRYVSSRRYPQQTWRLETGVADRTASGDDCTGLRTRPC